jgi:hypothetical protein
VLGIYRPVAPNDCFISPELSFIQPQMERPPTWHRVVFSDLGILALLALGRLLLHTLTFGLFFITQACANYIPAA